MYRQGNTVELIQQLPSHHHDPQVLQQIYCDILRSLTPAQRTQLGEVVVAKMIRLSQVMNAEICQELEGFGLIQLNRIGSPGHDAFYVPTPTGEAALMSIYRHYHGNNPY